MQPNFLFSLKVHTVCFIFFVDYYLLEYNMGFPGGSDGKQTAHNAGDPGSVPGLGRFPGEGIWYLLQYSWTSPVAQLVKNQPIMQERETWV